MNAEAYIAATRAALVGAGLERREVDGTVYFAGGSGSTVVLLHGANDQAGTWAPVVPLLANHRLIVPDLAGHGESAPATGPIAMTSIVERLRAIIDADSGAPPSSAAGPAASPPPRVGRRDGARPAGETPALLTLVGNSMGAWIALLYTLAHPECVERLILEAGGGLARPLAVPLTATTPEDALTILRAVHGPNAVLPEWAIDALLSRSTGSPMLRLTDLTFIDGRLGEIEVPTTLVWGADDGVVPRSYAEALRDGIAGARLHIIEGAAHIPHAQQPARFVECLTATF